jgi:hydroxymethylglutaryl-CoA lyase
MADTKDVIERLQIQNSPSKLLAIVANIRGAEEAVSFEKITYLGFPFSISPTFQQRNTNSTIEESLKRVEVIQNLCISTYKKLVVYVSMGFGNPYGDVYNEGILLYWAGELAQRGIQIISLADTVGIATSAQIAFALETLIPKYPNVEFGVHLHSSANNRGEKLEAAFRAGCNRFDGALKGIGGCPMAQDALVGNMSTEFMVEYFEAQNLPLAINKEALTESLQLASEIFV